MTSGGEDRARERENDATLKTCLRLPSPPGAAAHRTGMQFAGAPSTGAPSTATGAGQTADHADLAMLQSNTRAMAASLQRACGKLVVRLQADEHGKTRLCDLFQQGCLSARLPRSQRLGEVDVIMMNTAGGLTGGDRLSVDVSVGEGAHAALTTPACERLYRSIGGEVTIDQRLAVGCRARLDWIPQETILYDGGRVRRRLDVELADGAEITIAESLLLGRAAMGESVERGSYQDFWTLRRAGRLCFADAVRIAAPIDRLAACPTVLGGRTALASIVHVGSDLTDKRDALRAAFAAIEPLWAGASVVGDVLVARMVAQDGRLLRRALLAALTCVRRERGLPRSFLC